MRLTTALIALSLCLTASAQDEVNLSIRTNWGIPTALASAPNMSYTAQKAADDNGTTAWISEADAFPLWFRVEWRLPVQINSVSFRQFPSSPYEDTGAIGAYALESLMDGAWREIASGDCAAVALDEEVTVELEAPIVSEALRLVVKSADGKRVALSELRTMGPPPDLPMNFAPRWKGVWIWCEPSLVVPHREPVRRYFRRSFEIEDPGQVREAWLATCAFDRLNMFWVNNRQAASHISYSGASMREAEVTRVPVEWLVKGENVLAASVDDIYEAGSQGLLAELTLLMEDGTRRIIATDAEWVGQHDQGVVPKWREAGFSAADWPACKVKTWPNSRWHWLWNVPCPALAPPESFKVAGLRLDPPRPKPGESVACHVTFECASTPLADYAVIARLGQDSFMRNFDFELFGASLKPEEVKTSEWAPGRHEVTIPVRIPPETPRDAPATLLVSLPDQGAALESDLPGVSVDEYGLHFTVPVDGGPGVPPAGDDFPLAQVKALNGNPALHIDGRPTAPILWAPAYANYRRYSRYSSSGVKLFRQVIESSVIPAPGEAEEYYRWLMAQVDRNVAAALAVDPEIKILLALHMDPNPQVLFDEPSEQSLSGRGQLVIPLALHVPDRGQVRPTFMSQDWRRLGALGLKRIVGHMRSQSYAPSIIGTVFFAGRAGENYWGGNERNLFLDDQGEYDARSRETWDEGDFSTAARRTFREFLLRKYGTDQGLQKAWRRDSVRLDDVLDPARLPKEELCDILVWAGKPENAGSLRDPLTEGVGTLPADYFQCYSEAMIDTFDAWGRAVKEASDSRLITGCYYGYTLAQLFTSIPGFHGHTAVDRAARAENLDFYVSPAEYDQNRRAGGHYWGHNIIDSLRLHGKLWVQEQDTRTFLSAGPPKSYSRAETLEVLKRDAAAAITRGSGWWYCDFAKEQVGEGSKEWFDDDEILSLASHLKQVYEKSLALPDRDPSAQIAIFYHGETHTGQDIWPPTTALNISLGRLTLVNGMQRIGAAYDLLNLADIPELAQSGKLSQYRMCVFLNPFYLTAAERSWLEMCKSDGRTLVWLWAPGLSDPLEGLSAERVGQITGMQSLQLLQRDTVPTCRITDREHPYTRELPQGFELAPRATFPGAMWERFGNEIGPLPYIDPSAMAPDMRALGNWVIDETLREDMAALCVRRIGEGDGEWTSVYSAVPYLPPSVLRSIAREAGVHIYRDSEDVLYADRSFVAVHTGAQPAVDELRLPRATDVYDVFEGVQVGRQAESIKLDIPPYSTVMYLLGQW